EDRRVHLAQVARNLGAKAHPAQHVALEIHARRDLDQLKAVVAESQHAAFGDVEHGLAGRTGALAVEGNLRDRVDELGHRAVTSNAQPAVADGGFGAGRERPEEEQAAGGLANVDEAARADEPPAEAAEGDVAVSGGP